MAKEVDTPEIKYPDLKGEGTNVTTVNQSDIKPPEINPPAVTTKDWDVEWKTHFPDEDVETVKGYKTKALEYEPKVKEYEPKINDYEEKIKTLTEKRFFNERIAKLNELAELGVEITENTVAFLNKDYTKISDVMKGLAEDLRDQHPDWDEKEINFELRQKYNLDKLKQVIDPDGDGEALLPLTEEQKELKEISEIKQKRDWENAQKRLIDKQDKIRLVKPKTQEQIDKETGESAAKSQAWNETVKKVSDSQKSIKYEFPKDLPIKINDQQVEIAPFNYEVTKEDKAKASEYLANPSKLWSDLMGDAKTDNERFGKIYNFILKGLTADKAMGENAVAQYSAAYELSVKTDKKIGDVNQPRGQGAKTFEGKYPDIQKKP